MIIDEKTNAITLTRGDTGRFTVDLQTAEGDPFVPAEGDELAFLVADEEGGTPIIAKRVMGGTTIEILPEDTKDMAFGGYYYDLQLKLADGTVDTFINKAKFKVRWEAGD